MAAAITDIMPSDAPLGQNEGFGLRPTASQPCSTSPTAASIERIGAQGTMMSEPPPDGGLRAWSQVLAGHLINALTWYVYFSSIYVCFWILDSHSLTQLHGKLSKQLRAEGFTHPKH